MGGNQDVRSFFSKRPGPKKDSQSPDNPKKRPPVSPEKPAAPSDDDDEPVIKRRRKNKSETSDVPIAVEDVGDTNESSKNSTPKPSPPRKDSDDKEIISLDDADAELKKNVSPPASKHTTPKSTPARSEVISLDSDDDAPAAATTPKRSPKKEAAADKDVIAIKDDDAAEVISVDTPDAKTNGKKSKAPAARRGAKSKAEVISVEDAAGNKKKGKKSKVSPARSSDADSDAESEMEVDPIDTKKKGKDGGKFSLSSSSVATWKSGKPVPYKYLAEAFENVEAIKGRLAIQAILTDVFRTVIDTTPDDLVAIIYISTNQLAPSHEGVELGIGESIVLKALCAVTGKSPASVKKRYEEIGDLGDLAANTRNTQKTMFPPPPLTVQKVLKDYRDIAKMSGKNSQGAKVSRIVKLLVASSTKSEAKYITRALIGKMRINLAVKTVVTSLAAAMVLKGTKTSSAFLLNEDGSKAKKLSVKDKSIEAEIKEAAALLQNLYSVQPVWDDLVSNLLRVGSVCDELKLSCKLTPGIPISPMLAKPTASITEVLNRFSEVEFTCEYKYDGERAQVHRLEDGNVKIYSRNAEDLTPKYPDLASSLPTALKPEFKGAPFILDGESVAYDIEKKKILPFQVLQHRKRKDVEEKNIEVKVCYFAFDILFFNGESLIHKSLKERREVMTKHFREQEGVFMFAKGHDSKETEEILTLLNASIKDGCEGLMVKALSGCNGTYEPANRTQNWLKVKKDYLAGCGDTFDLVPIGGYIGKGKRTGTYGAFLLACYDPDTEEYQSICKIGTGFSDALLEELAKFYNGTNEEGESRKLEAPKGYYALPESKNTLPDTWFEPCQVWEVKCADLSISPTHRAAVGKVDADKGIALRFPRFVRQRGDKKTEDATSAEQVAEMYSAQSTVTK